MKKKTSPLNALRKVCCYSEGGEVYVDDWGPVDTDVWEGSGILPDDYTPEPFGADLASILTDGLAPASDGADWGRWLTLMSGSQSAPAEGALQRIEIPEDGRIVTVEAQSPPPPQVLETRGAPAAFNTSPDGVRTHAIPNTNSSIVQLPNGQYALVQTQQETPTWQSLLKLGLGGLGAIAGYKGAKDARDAAEKYDNERRAQAAQKNEAYQQALGRLNLPGGYAALTPSDTKFRRPA